MQTTIISAKSTNNVIGKEGDLPWKLPADEAFLERQLQTGWLLTGRKSFEAPQGKWLFEGRSDVIVVTRQEDYHAGSALVAHSLTEAVELARRRSAERLVILGGASIYQDSMDLADELIITEVHATVEGDSFFPEIDLTKWKEVRREDHYKDAENPYDYSFVFYERK